MKKVMIHLLRHGKTEGPAALNGVTDVLVNATRQDDIAARLQASNYLFDHIISSPLKRCLDLASRVVTDIVQLNIMPELQEMNFGEFDGRSFDSLTPEEWGRLDAFWQSPTDHELYQGEPLGIFHQRVVTAWETRIANLAKDSLIITHGGVIRMIVAHVLHLDWKNRHLYVTLDIANQSITTIEVSYVEQQPYFSVKAIGVPL